MRAVWFTSLFFYILSMYSKFQIGLFLSGLALMCFYAIPRALAYFPLDFVRDRHDIQWEVYRGSLPVVLLLNAGWLLLGRVLRRLGVGAGNKKAGILVGTLVLSYVFRGDIVIYLGIVLAFYCVAKALARSSVFPAVNWTLAVCALNFAELSKDDRQVSQLLEERVFKDSFMSNSRHLLHWSSLFNMTLLRLLSFGFDYRLSLLGSTQSDHKQSCKECSPSNVCNRLRENSPAKSFGLLQLLQYVMYPCILLTGPPMSYNWYQNSVSGNLKTDLDFKWRYCGRTLLNFLAFQVFTRTIKVGSFVKKPQLWINYSVVQMEVLSLWSVAYVWFKYLVIWRISRAFALLDGMPVYQNMNRCVFNNYSVEGFWRGWHRGFNQWIIRYMFVPLGGSKWKVLSVWPIFAFVAFWHDAKVSLVIWAWLCCLAIAPQVIARNYFKNKKFYGEKWFRYVSALGGALVIKLLVLLNSIGFGLGETGWQAVRGMVFKWSLSEWLLSWVILSSAVHLMYWVRDAEGWSKGY